MKRWLIGFGVVLLVGALAMPAMAGHGWHRGYGGYMMGPGCGYGGHMMGYGSWGGGPGYFGDLSPEQAKKLDALRQKSWEDTRSLREEMFTKRQELWRLYSKEKPDQEAIEKLEKEMFDLGQKLREKHFAFRQEAREIAPDFQGPAGWGRRGYPGGPGWGRHHIGRGRGHMGPGWGGHMMGPGWGGHHMGPGYGGPMMGQGWGYGPCPMGGY